ncbi:hypothetical protein JXQ70_11520 [bacterium]|nr:hypothetical protein [bacterium]
MMARKTVRRPCASHLNWDDMDLEKKVEALCKWAELATEWMEKTHTWQGKVKEVMFTLETCAKHIMQATHPFTKKDGNGGPLPPKKPNEPNC